MPAPPSTASSQQVLVMGGGDNKMVEFGRHLEEVNVDFKENIIKKVEMIKLKDTDDL